MQPIRLSDFVYVAEVNTQRLFTTLMAMSMADQSSQPEKATAMDDEPRSYPKLVRLMGRYKDLSLFRSFNDLHLTNLLRMQAELAYLELSLDIARKEDQEAGGNFRPQFIKSFTLIRENAEVESTQHDLLEEIAAKLKEYGKYVSKTVTLRSTAKFARRHCIDPLHEHFQSAQPKQARIRGVEDLVR